MCNVANTQVSYALQLLRIADLFSLENEAGFSLYFSELEYDSIVVDADFRVHIVDPENLIVVDRQLINKGEGHNLRSH